MASSEQQTTVQNLQAFLVEKGILTREKLAALKPVEKSTGSALVDFVHSLVGGKVADEEEITKVEAEFFNLPYMDLRKYEVKPAILDLIPKESINFYNLVPFEAKDTELWVALTDPTNLQALQALEFLGQKAGKQIKLHLASFASVDTVMGRKQGSTSTVTEALKDIATTEQDELKAREVKKNQVEDVISDAPIIKIVDVILTNAIEGHASDIHIEPSDKEVRVRYRIDGILHTSLMLPLNVHAAIVSRIKILANLKIDEQRIPQDGRFHVDMAGKSIDMRVSVLPLIYGEKIVMRILDKSGAVPTLDQLGLRGKNFEWVMENVKKTHGIFLITGPTGSGKSTTLYAILSILNTTSVNIVTLEDPVEYFIPGVNQGQINPEVGLTFAAGLRSILRQDPNVIMVGEVRDKETAELAVHAALTGHLVFSTLHTNNSVGAMPRMIDMGIESFLLTASVNCVLAQRLVRKLCDNCRESEPVPQAAEEEIRKDLQGVPESYFEGIDLKTLKMYKPKGCEKCDHTGYRGRMGIYEVLPVTPEIQELVLNKASNPKIYEYISKLGAITMKQDGIVKVLRGETTFEEVLRVTTE